MLSYTFYTLAIHQNISRQTKTDTVTVYPDTLCFVNEAGTNISAHYVFPCKINCIS